MGAKDKRKDAKLPESTEAEALGRAAAGKAGKGGPEEEPLDEESLDHVLREAPL